MSSTETTRNSGLGADRPWLAFDAYVFDIDGTLLNSRDLVHYYAFQAALRDAYGCTRDISEVPLQGNTDIGILRATARLGGVSDTDFDEGLPKALDCMRRHLHSSGAVFRPEICPAIPELLETLRAKGKLLGIATGNLEVVGWAKLSAVGLENYFQFGSFSDVAETRSEIFRNAIIEVRRRLGSDATVCFLGDTPSDIAAARANHCPILAVATGIHTLDQLAALGPEFSVSCCTDLLAQP